ncbi:MAG: DUF5117 domain-containing protein [Acidobacteria bacterium]|nr:DUF5117 domain-containing protein [Acidobacteriota bacterium]
MESNFRHMSLFSSIAINLALLTFININILGQDPPSPPAPGGPPIGDRNGTPGQSREPEIRPYERVITKDAKSDSGVFTVHRIKERIYYEIPKNEIDREFLWVSQIAKTTLGVGYGGQAAGNRVVRWERVNNRVLLRNISYNVVADATQPIAKAVKAANNDAIIMAFNVEALGKDQSVVIDVTRLFTTEVTEFSARTRLRARGFDPSRSYVERALAFPENIEIEASHTFTNPPSETPVIAAPPNPFLGAGMGTGSATVLMHYSMIRLPAKPMIPRLFDERVGYFSVRKQDYGKDEQRAPERTYITRWRLEKKDPGAEISEPIKPIIYYIDPATPAKWVPFIKKGIEDWQPAFEAAGFRNAIIARDAPGDDPEWSPEDARYSVIRWLPSTIENASGPHIHDPRTGEILESDIQFYHNVMNLARAWYFVQVGPLDPRAQRLPLPDELMGELIRYVAAHEVGHTLGFQHNMKASSQYSIEQIRDPKFVKEMGHTPTLMDYSRFNYVAQPEDKIAVEDLIPKIGPYDKWATMWGYKPISGATSPEGEKETLDKWAREQDRTPHLRFSTARSRGSDPGENTEAVGDVNAVKATELGLKNLKRVADMLLMATSTSPGEPYDDLEEIFGRMLGQWRLELGHVTQIVGGFNSQQKHIGQDGVLFTSVPRDKQAAAVRFLNENAFSTPSWMIRPEILRRIEPDGTISRIRTAQQALLSQLLSTSRFARLIEQEEIDRSTYRAVDLLADVRRGVWNEIFGSGTIRIDAFRRNLQRAYLELMNDKLNGRTPVTDDQRPFIRGELKALHSDLVRSLPRAIDRAARMHLEDSRDMIGKILDPKLPQPGPAPSGSGGLPGRGYDGEGESPKGWSLHCWPETGIGIER